MMSSIDQSYSASEEYELHPKEIMSFHIDYKESISELCLIGAKYDTDKSPQQINMTNNSRCHPYTLFYNSLFKDKRDHKLVIAELGILNGASLLMWKEYFPHAKLYGFESNIQFINAFENNFDRDRITLAHMDIQDESSIVHALHSTGEQYDLIIENTTHLLEDQIRIIENVYSYLKPGGILIIEGISKNFQEQDYIDRLSPILGTFQDYYFISMDHKNRNSSGWDDNKLFVLVKGGANPIFQNKRKITIITPSMRPGNLIAVKNSINFDYVDEWIIVYDGSKILENPHLFTDEENGKIKEYIHESKGMSGNPQRNYALDLVQNEDTYLYFVDDDNVIHKDLYKLLDIIDDGKIYTFDQENRLKGNVIAWAKIDTAMILIDFKLCRNQRWILDRYGADFFYFNACYKQNKDKWIYVNNVLCTYNKLPR